MTPALKSLFLASVISAIACNDVTPRMPTVRVEKYEAQGDCFSTCGGAIASEVEQALGQKCTTPAGACELAAGSDKLRVTVDYGAVPFALTTVVAPPSLVLRMGENETTASPPWQSTRYAQGAAYSSVFFSTILYVPAQPASTLQVIAKSGEGFTTASEALPVSAPRVTLTLPGCMNSEPCSMMANVGSAQVQISAGAAFAPAQGRISSRLDGVERPDTQTVDLVRVHDQLVGNASLLVPVPSLGQSSPISTWEISATFGSLPPRTVAVRLTRPSLSVVVRNCPVSSGGGAPPPCSLKAGSNAVVDFVVPANFNAPQGTLTSSLDGIPTPLRVSGSFANSGFATATYSTTLSLPNQPGALFAVQGQAGPYIESSAPITLLP